MTEEEITDRIAQEVAERIGNRPVSPEFRRRLVRLYTLQAVGELPPPAEITLDELGEALGIGGKSATSATLSRALAKCWRTIHRDYPDYLP